MLTELHQNQQPSILHKCAVLLITDHQCLKSQSYSDPSLRVLWPGQSPLKSVNMANTRQLKGNFLFFSMFFVKTCLSREAWEDTTVRVLRISGYLFFPPNHCTIYGFVSLWMTLKDIFYEKEMAAEEQEWEN